MTKNMHTETNQSDISISQLGQNYQAFISQFGPPLNEFTKDTYVILKYHSDTETLAQYAFFANDQLVFKQIGRALEPKTLQYYIDQYGNPERSIKRYGNDVKDSFLLTVHVWPSRGQTIITEGTRPISNVYQTQEFSPTTLETYLLRWGQDFAQNQKQTVATIAAAPKAPTLSLPNAAIHKTEIAALVATLIVTGIILYYLRRTKKAH